MFTVSSSIYIWAFKVWYLPKLKVRSFRFSDGNFSTCFTIFFGALAFAWINYKQSVCSKPYLLLLSKCHHIQKHRPFITGIHHRLCMVMFIIFVKSDSMSSSLSVSKYEDIHFSHLLWMLFSRWANFHFKALFSMLWRQKKMIKNIKFRCKRRQN